MLLKLLVVLLCQEQVLQEMSGQEVVFGFACTKCNSLVGLALWLSGPISLLV